MGFSEFPFQSDRGACLVFFSFLPSKIHIGNLYFACYKSFPPSPSQNQAKLFIEQKKIPFPADNHNVNEELGKFVLHWSTNLVYTQKIYCLSIFFFFFHYSYRLCSDRQWSLWWSHQTLLTPIAGKNLIFFSPNIILIGLNVLLKACVCGAGGPRAGQRHLRARDGLWEKKSAGEQSR